MPQRAPLVAQLPGPPVTAFSWPVTIHTAQRQWLSSKWTAAMFRQPSPLKCWTHFKPPECLSWAAICAAAMQRLQITSGRSCYLVDRQIGSNRHKQHKWKTENVQIQSPKPRDPTAPRFAPTAQLLVCSKANAWKHSKTLNVKQSVKDHCVQSTELKPNFISTKVPWLKGALSCSVICLSNSFPITQLDITISQQDKGGPFFCHSASFSRRSGVYAKRTPATSQPVSLYLVRPKA